MKIKSLVSIVARSENAKDRRLAIRKSWSPSEMEERRQDAIRSQLRLVSIMDKVQQKSNRVKEVLELADCC